MTAKVQVDCSKNWFPRSNSYKNTKKKCDFLDLDLVLLQITCGQEIFFHKKLDYVWVLYYKASDLISELVSFL